MTIATQEQAKHVEFATTQALVDRGRWPRDEELIAPSRYCVRHHMRDDVTLFGMREDHQKWR